MTFCEYVAKGFLGNRITALTAATIGSMSLDGSPNQFLFPIIFGIGFGSTGFGLDTYKEFKKTEKAVKEQGYLDKEWFKDRMMYLSRYTSKSRFIGYCNLQGMFLAAKKYYVLNEFKSARKEVSDNLIPNF